MVFGKNCSVNGRVMIGHNEDDDNSTIQMHVVPRRRHQPGETVSFGDRPDVKIPQVEETAAIYWSEVRRPGGISFGDVFFNEYGVSVASNSSFAGSAPVDENGSSEAYLKSLGIGYGVRRLVAERAKTAREGLDILIDLVETYGYFSSRTYHVSDKNECWSVQVTKGKRLAAKRIPDDHVYFMPNHYTIHALEPSDKVNFYYTPDLVDFAVKSGFYTPSKPGDYSDFDFAKAYNDHDESFNVVRARNAWPMLGFEKEWNEYSKDGDTRPFSFKAKRKYGVEDAKALMRTHYEGRPDGYAEVLADGTVSYPRNPHREIDFPMTICSATTVESTVVEFADDVKETCIHRTLRMPCMSPYVPLFVGAFKLPEAYEWMDPETSDATHFAPPASDFEFDPSNAYWQTENLIWQSELDYGFAHKLIAPEIKEIEKKWAEETAEARGKYEELKKEDPKLAEEFLSSFSDSKARFALAWTLRMTQTIGKRKHDINQKLIEE